MCVGVCAQTAPPLTHTTPSPPTSQRAHGACTIMHTPRCVQDCILTTHTVHTARARTHTHTHARARAMCAPPSRHTRCMMRAHLSSLSRASFSLITAATAAAICCGVTCKRDSTSPSCVQCALRTTPCRQPMHGTDLNAHTSALLQHSRVNWRAACLLEVLERAIQLVVGLQGAQVGWERVPRADPCKHAGIAAYLDPLVQDVLAQRGAVHQGIRGVLR